jgi:GxxExxY protein
MEINRISGIVVDSAIKVHSALGPGLLESTYEKCLCHEMRTRGYRVDCQVPVPVRYGLLQLEIGYRLDLLIENLVVVELKAVSRLLPIHEAQLLSYLKLSGHRVGLLINFHVLHLKDGIKRMVHRL